MRYLFDPQKNAANIKVHGYAFEDAPRVIEGSNTVTFEDRRFDYAEQRFITLGSLRGAVVVVVTVVVVITVVVGVTEAVDTMDGTDTTEVAGGMEIMDGITTVAGVTMDGETMEIHGIGVLEQA